MKLVEQHICKYNKEMDELCFQSKNLYNSCLYIIRQHFCKTNIYIGFKQLYNSIKIEPIWNDCKLPKKVNNQIVKLIDQNFNSFFKANNSYKKNPSKFLGKPKIPNYKNSVEGRLIVIYEKGALSKREFNKTGLIHLSQTNIKIKTQIKDFNLIKQVRIIPKHKHFIIEVIYEQKEKAIFLNNNYAAIDLGLNNLATVSFNDGKNPFIINGKPVKSINQFFNKEKAKKQSTLERRNKLKKSNGIYKLNNKRNNKIKDYLHKSSKYIVNQLVSKNISTLIIGKNKNWKQDINIGKRNNQNFVNIPFYMFINMLKYKCKLEGISIIEQEESYTSKCSFIDSESIKKHIKYKGRRIKRGLFKSLSGKIINADLNGSYNIMKKAIQKNSLKEFNWIEGFSVNPMVITP